MNLLKGFDYIYYRVYHIYKNKWKDNTPDVYAVGLVSLLQALLTIMLPLLINSAVNSTKISVSNGVLFGSFMLFVAFNYFRYFKVTNYERLAKKWKHEKKVNHFRNGVFIVLLFVIAITTCIILAIVNFENRK